MVGTAFALGFAVIVAAVMFAVAAVAVAVAFGDYGRGRASEAGGCAELM